MPKKSYKQLKDKQLARAFTASEREYDEMKSAAKKAGKPFAKWLREVGMREARA